MEAGHSDVEDPCGSNPTHAQGLQSLLSHWNVTRPGGDDGYGLRVALDDGCAPVQGDARFSAMDELGDFVEQLTRLGFGKPSDENVLPGGDELPGDACNLRDGLALTQDHLRHPETQRSVMVDLRVAEIREREPPELLERGIDRDVSAADSFEQLLYPVAVHVPVDLVHAAVRVDHEQQTRGRPRGQTGEGLPSYSWPWSADGVIPLTAPLLAFVLGVLYAWAASDELARAGSGWLGSRAIVLVSVFGLLVPVPITGYFLALAQDWSYAYCLEDGRLATALDMCLVAATGVSTPIGFRMAAPSATSRELRPAVGLVTGPLLLTAVVIAALMPRLSVFGTYAQFHGDFGTRPLAGSFVGTALLWTNAILVGSAVFTFRCLQRMTSSRRPPQRP